MGLDNPIHIAVVLLVVLLVFGAKRLPEMGRSLGGGLRGFKDSLQGVDPTSDLALEGPKVADSNVAQAHAAVQSPALQPVEVPSPAIPAAEHAQVS